VAKTRKIGGRKSLRKLGVGGPLIHTHTGMNAQDLLEYLEGLATLRANRLEGIDVRVEGTGALITAKVYDENHDGELDMLYLVYK